MFGFVELILVLFGFTKYQEMVAFISILLLLSNLLGGLLSNIIVASSGPRKPRKLTAKISFRLCLSAELFVILFAAYYHAIMIESIEPAHIVFWLSSLAIAPILAYLGAQITYVIYARKIEADKKAYRAWASQRRERRKKQRRKDERRKDEGPEPDKGPQPYQGPAPH